MSALIPDIMTDAAAQFLLAGDVPLIADLVAAPIDPVPPACREAQNALRAAISSADNAIRTGYVMNRVAKAADGKDARGSWRGEALDTLRSATLFAGAGVDRAVKVLADDAIPVLLSRDDDATQSGLAAYSKRAITGRDKAIDPVVLVNLFLSKGQTPREILANQWIKDLTSSSAQSADRLQQLAQALGVRDRNLLRRLQPSSDRTRLTDLETAFRERNQVAHELDITKPTADVRQPLEKIKRGRSPNPVRQNCVVMLGVAQEIVNDVAARVA